MRSVFSSLALAALFVMATAGFNPPRAFGATTGSLPGADLAAADDLDPTAAGDAQARTARLQVIHNAADPAAAVVDVYVNGELFKDDFAFRTATPFVRVPAGVTLNVAVAPGNSGSVADAIATFPVVLERGKRYVAIANGILGQGFAANPDGRSIAFTLFARDGVRQRSGERDEVKLLAFHGATDAPTVDVLVRGKEGSQVLFDNLAYGDFSQYVTVEDEKYILDVTPGADNSTVVASFDADLRTLGGGAAVVFASGFLSPAANNGGPAFGLYAALPSGAVAALPARQEFAQFQAIHNAADPAAAVVDIYVNGTLFKDDFAFRTATPFVSVPALTQLVIGVAPGNSSSAADIIATFPVTLQPNRRYVAIANGILGQGFAANPDGRSIAFTLFARDGVRERSRERDEVKLLAFHGATDAPTVDILARRQGRSSTRTLFNDLAYGNFSKYVTLDNKKYVLDVTPGADNSTVVASFEADLRTLGGGAAVVFASGFLSPAANNDGPAFGLYAALPSGAVAALPAVTTLAAKADGEPGDADGPETQAVPTAFSLAQNSPNPFNPATQISFSLPEAAAVRLVVFNARGQVVRTLVNGTLPSGSHRVDFQADGLPSGAYFYKIDAGTFSQTKKMLLLK